MTTPDPRDRPAWRTDGLRPPGWPTLPNWPGYNVPVNPDEATIIVRIRQSLPRDWDRASIRVNGRDVFPEWDNGVIAIGVRRVITICASWGLDRGDDRSKGAASL